MQRTGEISATSGTDHASDAAAGTAAVRRANDVWVLPAARIKQILRGTFLENPTIVTTR